MSSVCIITARIPPARCGVGDQMAHFARNLREAGAKVTVLTHHKQASRLVGTDVEVRNILANWGITGMVRMIREIEHLKPDRLVVGWVPHFYHPKGLTMSLPLALLYLRFRGYFIHSIINELWVDVTGWKTLIASWIQKIALSLVILSSRKPCFSVKLWQMKMSRSLSLIKRGPIYWIPITSNLPNLNYSAAEIQKLRSKLGIPNEGFCLATINPIGSGRSPEFVAKVWEILKKRHANIYLLQIGVSNDPQAPKQGLPEGERVLPSGYLSEADFSLWLSLGDAYIANFVDGFTGKRGSVLTALEHGLPTITNFGHCTHPDELKGSPLIIANYDPQSFADAISELIRDPIKKAALSRATRKFHDAHYSWSKIFPQHFPEITGSDFLPVPHRFKRSA